MNGENTSVGRMSSETYVAEYVRQIAGDESVEYLRQRMEELRQGVTVDKSNQTKLEITPTELEITLNEEIYPYLAAFEALERSGMPPEDNHIRENIKVNKKTGADEDMIVINAVDRAVFNAGFSITNKRNCRKQFRDSVVK